MSNPADFNNQGSQANSRLQDAYCQSLASIYIQYIKLKKQYKSNKSKLDSILTALLHPLRALATVAATELASAIGAVASAIVAQVAATASGAMKALLEALFKRLLSILTAGANEIFGIIALPLKKAKQYASSERMLLSQASFNLSVVLRIVSKWMSGADGDLFYRKMKEALPYLERAVNEMSAMITELEVGTSETANAYFNNARYRRIVGYLQEAIRITDQDTFAVQALGLTNAMEGERRASFSNKMIKIDEDYRAQKKKIDDDYRAKVIKIQQESASKILNTPGEGFKAGVSKTYESTLMQSKLSIAEGEWKLKMDDLKTNHDFQKANANLSAFDASYYKNLGARIGQNAENMASEFSRDYHIMVKNMSEMLDNITRAFIAYKQCQLFTGFTYSSIERIKALIKWLIAASAEAGNATGDATAQTFRASRSLVQGVDAKFSAATPTNDSVFSPSGMAFDMKWGNIKLRLASSLLSGVVTKSLVDMINFDEILTDEQVRFNRFRSDIETIPDWDGKLGTWGTMAISLSVSPYISMSAKLAALLATVRGSSSATSWSAGVVGLDSQGTAAKMAGQAVGMSWANAGIGKGLKDLRKDVDRASNHNAVVIGVLNTYTPYNSGEVSALENFLNSVGLNYLTYALMAVDVVALRDSLNDMTFAAFSIHCFDTPDKIDKYLSALPEDQRVDLKAEIARAEEQTKTKINNSTALSRSEGLDFHEEKALQIIHADIKNFMTDGADGSKRGLGPMSPFDVENVGRVYSGLRDKEQ